MRYIIRTSPSNFQEYLNHLPQYQRDIIGQITIPDDDGESLFWAIYHGTAIGVSLGIMNQASRTAVHSLILSTNNQQSQIHCQAPTPSTRFLLSQHRTDLYGHLALYLTTKHLIKYHLSSGLLTSSRNNSQYIKTYSLDSQLIPNLKMYTTNKTIIKNLKTQSTPKYDIQSTTQVFEPDQDVYCELRQAMNTIPLRPSIPLRGSIQLPINNNPSTGASVSITDSLFHQCQEAGEKLLRDQQTQNKQPPLPLFLPHSEISVLHKNTPIHSHLVGHIRLQATKDDIVTYSIKKMNLTADHFYLIDWTAFQCAFESIPTTQRTTLLKLIHSWQDTGHQQSKISKQTSPSCPHCASPETSDHVFQCTADHILPLKHAAISTFMHGLIKLNTAPSITLFLSEHYLPWLFQNDEPLLS